MAVREVPRSFVYICDVCSKQHTQENAGGMYTEGVPPTWSKLQVSKLQVFEEGSRVVNLLLCDTCAHTALTALRKFGILRI